MDPKRINASLSVSEQIAPEAIAAVTAAGFISVICNRPDGEGADQLGFAEIEAAAKAAGLPAAYQPVISGKVTDSDAQAFGALFASLPKPVFAYCRNPLKDLGKTTGADAVYDGYGSCPLTVERGKIVLAEFGYGGKLLPSFPTWLIDGTQPNHLAWLLKVRILPPIYWQAMLRGREWMAKPQVAA